jgi:hypothetical protein
VHEGEATEVTRRLVEDEGLKFNMILSDTYPLTEEQKGVNDIQDIEVIKNGLYRNGEGVFAFYSYFPGFDSQHGDGFITATQARILRDYFPERRTDVAEVKPPRDYDYLLDHNGDPVRKLPVVIGVNY